METSVASRRPRVAVIILSFNGRTDLESCLPSVLGSSATLYERHTIVVDNASSDGSLELARSIPEVEVLPQATNLGFAAGNNVGLRRARQLGCTYAVLLNQDTVVTPSWLDELVAVAEDRPEAGAVQSLLTLWPRGDLVNSWGNDLHYLGFAMAGGNGHPLADLRDTQVHSITYPSGAAVLLRLSTLDALDGDLEEALVTYHEDVELGWRMHLAGYEVLIAPRSVVHHRYEFLRSVRKIELMERNRWLLTLAYWKLPTLLLLAPALLLMELGQLALSAARGWLSVRLRVYGSLLSLGTWRTIGRLRRRVAKLRRQPDAAMLRRCIGAVRYQFVDSFALRLANPLFGAYLRALRLAVRW